MNFYQALNKMNDSNKPCYMYLKDSFETINDEDLVYIANNDYTVYDFCEKGSYHRVELFDMELNLFNFSSAPFNNSKSVSLKWFNNWFFNFNFLI